MAMTNIRAIYHDGLGTAQDYAKAAEYYRQALEAGYVLIDPTETEHVKELLGTEVQ